MKLMVLTLVVFILMFLFGVLYLRKCYIEWCKSYKDKRKSKELMNKMEFLVKFIAVMILLIIFVATMIYDCFMMKGGKCYE